MTLAHEIKKIGYTIGFDLVGVTPLVESEHRRMVEDWVAQQRHGSMGWYEKNIDRRVDPRRHLFGQARSVITVGLLYRPVEIDSAVLHDPSRGVIARYALYSDYHSVMERMLNELAGRIGQKLNHAWKYRVYVDTGPLLEREVAQKGGLGFVGKNTTLINTEIGSYFFLGEIVTDVQFEVGDVGIEKSPITKHQFQNTGGTCAKCTRCQTACPTQAFVGPYVLDARKCISYLTIEHRGSIPVQYRPLMGNRIYGCDICQEVCPWNKKSSTVLSALQPRVDPVPHLLDVVGLSESQFKDAYAGTPILRTKREGFIRNVLVAIGNWGDRAALEPVKKLCDDESALVREHAAWAEAVITADR